LWESKMPTLEALLLSDIGCSNSGRMIVGRKIDK